MEAADEFVRTTEQTPRAIVVGAGPAGSLAAVLLARDGWTVTLIEQQTFPRDKVCGECLSALGLAVLERARLMPRLRAKGMVRLRRASLWSTTGRSVQLNLPGEMAGLSRAMLDTELRDAAAEAGATLLQPARCEGIEPGIEPTVKVRELSTNRVVEIQADVVLLADGKGGITAGLSRPKNADLGVKCHLTAVVGPRDAIELFGLPGHYLGLAAIDGDRWNLAMSVPRRLVQKCGGDFDRLLVDVLNQNVALAARLSTATRASAWHSSPLPRYAVAEKWPDGVILIGNAAAALEPIGGEGMGLAIASAELAVDHLHLRFAHYTGESENEQRRPRYSDLGSLKQTYRSLWKRRRMWCRTAAVVSSRPSWTNLAIEMVDAEQRLAAWFANQMGKSSVKV